MGLTNLGRALGRYLQPLTSLNLLTLSGIQLFSIHLFRMASILALLVGLDLSFLISMLAQFFNIAKVAPFEYVDVFCKDPFLALYFFLFSSMIFLLVCFFSLAAIYADDVAIWSPSHSVFVAMEATQAALIRLKR